MNILQIRLGLLALVFYPIFYGTWLFYLAFMDIKRNQTIYKAKMGIAWYGLYPIFIFALFMDVLFNWTVGTVYFREPPREFLFTARCQRHLNGTDVKQYDRAQYVCDNLLNPADSGHCV